MRYILTALMVLAFATAAASANSLGFFGAYWDPDELDHAYGVGGKLQLEVAPSVYIEARATYFPKTKDKEDDSLKLDIIPVEAAGILKFPVDQLTPYAGGGIGYYIFRIAEEPAGVSAEVENKVGLFAVAGLELSIGDAASLFGEAKYTWLDDVELKASAGGVSDESKGKLSGFGANAGLLLKW